MTEIRVYYIAMIPNSRQYNTLHVVIGRYFTKTGVCEICDTEGKTEWADKNGKYVYNRDEFLELCKKCHSIYDSLRRYEAKLQKSPLQK